MSRFSVCLAVAVSSCSATTHVVETPRPIAPAPHSTEPAPAPVAAAVEEPPAQEPPAATAPEPAPYPGPFHLEQAVVYPPIERTRPRPVTVFLHGMCDVPENECPWIAPAATEHGWLVCPRASLACQGGGAAWSFTHAGENVEAAVERLVAARPGEVDASERTLMGFSLGGMIAMSLAQAGPGRWSHLVVIAAKVSPDRRRLARAGVKSVVFAAGDYDMTHGVLQGAARRLDRAGFPAMFLSLGKVGHTFPADMDSKMQAALDFTEAGG